MAKKKSKATLALDAKMDRLFKELETITEDEYTTNKDRLRIIQIKTELGNLMRGGKDTTLDKKKGGAVMKKRGGTFKGVF